MTRFECENCGKTFPYKKNLIYHTENGACKVCDYSCKYCDKKFTSATNMYRHMRTTCKVKKEEDDEKAKIYERLLKLEEDNKIIQEENKTIHQENIQLKKKMITLEKNVKGAKIVKGSYNTKINNINNGIVAHINLIGYGNEDLSKIDKNEIIKAVQHGFNSTIKLTETLHFNPRHPEYHNVYITNMKDKYAMVYDGKNWNLMMKDDLINKIYDDKKNYIEENLDDFLDSLSAARKKALDRWLETDDDDEKISRIKDEIKLLLYNKREIVLEKQKEIVPNVKLLKRVGSTFSKKVQKDDVSDED